MALIFEMWVECNNEADAERQKKHFDGLSFTLLDGFEVSWTTEIERTSSMTSGVSIWSKQLSDKGVRTVEDAVNMSECGVRLYHHLLSAPDFLFAHAAVEANIPASQITDFFTAQQGGFNTCSLHCVLHEKLAQQFEPLGFFREFRPGYVWNRYYGEWYRPLGSNDHPELLLLKQQLLQNNS